MFGALRRLVSASVNGTTAWQSNASRSRFTVRGTGLKESSVPGAAVNGRFADAAYVAGLAAQSGETATYLKDALAGVTDEAAYLKYACAHLLPDFSTHTFEGGRVGANEAFTTMPGKEKCMFPFVLLGFILAATLTWFVMSLFIGYAHCLEKYPAEVVQYVRFLASILGGIVLVSVTAPYLDSHPIQIRHVLLLVTVGPLTAANVLLASVFAVHGVFVSLTKLGARLHAVGERLARDRFLSREVSAQNVRYRLRRAFREHLVEERVLELAAAEAKFHADVPYRGRGEEEMCNKKIALEQAIHRCVVICANMNSTR